MKKFKKKMNIIKMEVNEIKEVVGGCKCICSQYSNGVGKFSLGTESNQSTCRSACSRAGAEYVSCN